MSRHAQQLAGADGRCTPGLGELLASGGHQAHQIVIDVVTADLGGVRSYRAACAEICVSSTLPHRFVVHRPAEIRSVLDMTADRNVSPADDVLPVRLDIGLLARPIVE